MLLTLIKKTPVWLFIGNSVAEKDQTEQSSERAELSDEILSEASLLYQARKLQKAGTALSMVSYVHASSYFHEHP